MQMKAKIVDFSFDNEKNYTDLKCYDVMRIFTNVVILYFHLNHIVKGTFRAIAIPMLSVWSSWIDHWGLFYRVIYIHALKVK